MVSRFQKFFNNASSNSITSFLMIFCFLFLEKLLFHQIIQLFLSTRSQKIKRKMIVVKITIRQVTQKLYHPKTQSILKTLEFMKRYDNRTWRNRKIYFKIGKFLSWSKLTWYVNINSPFHVFITLFSRKTLIGDTKVSRSSEIT